MWESIINNQLLKKYKPSFSLSSATVICSFLFYSNAFAAGFGSPSLHSYLGQALNVQIPISGISQDDLTASCIKATVKTIDGDFIASPRMEFIYPKSATPSEQANAATLINLITKEKIIEPAVALSVALQCGPLMQRTYSLLLDYSEYSSPATVTIADNAAKQATLAPPSSNFTESIDVKNAAPAPALGSASGSSNARVSTTKKSKKSETVVQPKNKISKKIVAQVASPADQLKLSNEEIRTTKAIPSVVEKPIDTKPVDVELQRIQENTNAQDQFAAMLRDEPALLAEQAREEKNEEKQKIQSLEKELAQLKLQIQSNSKPIEQPHYPMPLLVMNGIVLVLLCLVLFVVGKLWLSLRKERQPHSNPWWNAPADQQRIAEARAEARNDQSTHAEQETVLDPALDVPQMNKQDDLERLTSSTEQNAKLGTSAANLEDTNSTFNLFTSRRNQSIQIEELSDFTQEAEFWVSINNPKRAIEILEPQCLDENLTMPVSLLYLLDLYRLVKDEDKYTKLRDRLKHKFNIAIPTFNESAEPTTWKHLEDYEHVTSRCCAFWNTNYIVPYLESLLIDDREGERIGFDLSVYRDILFLISLCKELDRIKDSSTTSV